MEVLRVKALLTIRKFRKGLDEETYVRIYNAVFTDYDDIRTMTLDEMKKVEKSPSFSDEGIFLAEWDGEAVGMIDAFVDKLREERKGFIQSLGVLPQFRRKGIARALVQKALESHKRRGMIQVDAWAQAGRQGCIHIFETFGFKRIRCTSMMKRSLRNIESDVGENMRVNLREMRLTDEDDVVLLNRLDNEAFKEHFNFRPRSIEETKHNLLESPWFQGQKAYFAVLDDQSVGYIITAIDQRLVEEKRLKWGWIWDIGVLKQFRRTGIGTRLMIQGMRTLKSQGMDDALLYVDDQNPTKAIKLYEKVGFNVVQENFVYQLSLS
jgi:mycothiol synthase